MSLIYREEKKTTVEIIFYRVCPKCSILCFFFKKKSFSIDHRLFKIIRYLSIRIAQLISLAVKSFDTESLFSGFALLTEEHFHVEDPLIHGKGVSLFEKHSTALFRKLAEGLGVNIW